VRNIKHGTNYWISTHTDIPVMNRKVLNEYLLSIKLENKAEATIKKYRSVLEKFLIECTEPLEELSSDNVIQWINQYTDGKKSRTVDLIISTLSSFFKFCLAEDYTKTMLVKKRWKPKIPDSLPKYLSQKEYARVKREAESLSQRDRAVILFLFSTGCRISEVVGLNRDDINLKQRTALVKGKGSEIRTVHFTEECALVLSDYLQSRKDDYEFLFLNKFDDRLAKTGIYLIAKKLGERAGLDQRLHPHMFRHTFATTMLSKGADL